MKITNIIENTSGISSCRPEHGLSFYIETQDHKILMDTGASNLITTNAAKLNIPLSEVDTVVISHGHYDHGGGLKAFLQINDKAEVYIHQGAFEEYYSLHEGKEPKYIGLLPELKGCKQITTVHGLHKIDQNIELFSDITCIEEIPSANRELKKKTDEGFIQDDFNHEQCLVIREGGKSVLFSGCAHHGILNIMKRYCEVYNEEPDVVISGFHFMKTSGYSEEDKQEIKAIAQKLKNYQTKFYTCHCTDVKPYEIMKEIMGEQLSYVHCGDEIIL